MGGAGGEAQARSPRSGQEVRGHRHGAIHAPGPRQAAAARIGEGLRKKRGSKIWENFDGCK